MMHPHPLISMALVVGTLLGMMRGLRTLKGRLHPELLRKLLHVGMGLVTLSFPWLFASDWPVVILAVGSSAGLLLLRQSSALRSRLGGVVDGVERQSFGEVYFPIGVAVLFVLSQGDPVAYSVPLLLLALGDAVAALVGVRYGSMRYTTSEGQKSWEGSIAFFLVAFLSVHIPLLLFTETGRAESLFIGLTMGLLVMLLEAVAWRGLDNLFIPLGGFMLLRAFRRLDATTLGGFLLVALLLVAFALVWRRRTTLNDSAVLGAALIAFVAWAVGGWRWLIPPMTLFSLYALLFPRANADGTSRTHDVYDVLQATGVGMLWLFAASTLERPAYLLPYTVSFAAQLAIIGVTRYGAHFRDAQGKGQIVAVVLKSLAVLLVPFGVLEYVAAPTFPRPLLWVALLVCAPAGVFLGVVGERLGAGDRAGSRLVRRRWLRQVGVFVGSALPLAVLALGKASG